MGNKKSLTYLISKYAIFELVFTVFLIFLSYFLLQTWIRMGLLYPANYADNYSDRLAEDFVKDEWNRGKIPFFYEYQYLENGKVVQNTIDQKYGNQIEEALEEGNSSTNNFIETNIFKAFSTGERQLVIKYKISAIPSSPKMFRQLKNFEFTYFSLLACIWLLGLSFLIIRSAKLLKQEIYKISEANASIGKMDLEYQRKNSKYREISGVLDSIDSLAKDLKISLEKQWQMQIKQKEMVESITHDIRTPITLIKGNLELLKEDKENFSQRVDDISNGVDRLESFIERLKDFSYSMEGPKGEVREEVLKHWIKLTGSICRLSGYKLQILAKETSSIELDKETISIALQNLVNNSMENSPKGSTISLGFYDKDKDFSIVVRDNGVGFDYNILKEADQRFVSSKKKDSKNIHGLGLSIVNKILESNKGRLLLSNSQGGSFGAEAKMVFNK